MTKQTGKDPTPYVIIGNGRDQNLRFYKGYDEHFLFNKVASFLYIFDEGEPAVQQIEERLIAHDGAKLSERYLESIRAEVFFTAVLATYDIQREQSKFPSSITLSFDPCKSHMKSREGEYPCSCSQTILCQKASICLTCSMERRKRQACAW